MDGLDRDEYRVLRATIARRGTIRSVLFLSGIAAWSALLAVALVWLPFPIAAVIPLMVLVATFEAIRPLHFGAERIGRYLQVFYEEAGGPRPVAVVPSWERTAMVFGGGVPGAGGHPLFAPVFGLATLVNYLAVVLARASRNRAGLACRAARRVSRVAGRDRPRRAVAARDRARKIPCIARRAVTEGPKPSGPQALRPYCCASATHSSSAR